MNGKKPYTLIGLAVLFGVLLPAITLVLELTYGMCSDIFFNPIPTVWHAMFVALVPIVNLLGCIILCKPEKNGLMKAFFYLVPVSIAVSLYYTMIFLVMTPFAVMGIIVFGIGLLPLSPHFSLLFNLLLRRRAKINAEALGCPVPRLWPIILVMVGIILITESRMFAVYYGLDAANSSDAKERNRGLRILRVCATEDDLLNLCYRTPSPVMSLSSFAYNMGQPLPVENVRTIFYRITGQPFNSIRPPVMKGLRGSVLVDPDEWDFDQGGEMVGGIVKGLGLSQSRIDGIVNADAGTAYIEWIMEFKNDSNREREARAQIVLPPGAVVSRLTLWINGEEREAAFGGRAQTREAYQKVVVRRRDPVLVTTCGPDKVMLQCFPVPSGQTMKTKIGVTIPLYITESNRAVVILPKYAERNFRVDADFKHALWVEGNKDLKAVTEAGELSSDSGKNVLRGDIKDKVLEKGFVIGMDRSLAVNKSWSEDVKAKDGKVILQEIIEVPANTSNRIVVVVDGSLRMAQYSQALAKSITKIDPGRIAGVLIASDDVVELMKGKDVKQAILDFKYQGGCDNMPALSKAWDLLGGNKESLIIWIHATQPVDFNTTEPVIQKWQRGGGPAICDLQLGSGPNKTIEKLSNIVPFREIPNMGDYEADIGNVCGRVNSVISYKYRWSRCDGPQADAVKGNDHIVRLWAKDEIESKAKSIKQADKDEAVRQAKLYQLVTTMSGAVVLENKQQYDEAGLEAVNPESVPYVTPEPSTIVLIIIGALLLLYVRWRKRKLAYNIA